MSPQPTPTIAHFGFLTLRQFSMIAFTNAIEPLRMANYLAEQTIYRWSVYSLDGEPVPASNGLTVTQTSHNDTGATVTISLGSGNQAPVIQSGPSAVDHTTSSSSVFTTSAAVLS